MMPHRRRRDMPDAGPGDMPLLSAISEGLCVRDWGYNAPYLFDGQPVDTTRIRRLARTGWIEAAWGGGPPHMTLKGWDALHEHYSRKDES